MEQYNSAKLPIELQRRLLHIIHMTRKQASKAESILKARGVYKPYVSGDKERMYIESYPLTAIVQDGGCDREQGPFQTVKLTDSSLARLGQDSTVATARVYFGSDLLACVAGLMLERHTEAHERATQQDEAALAAVRS